MRKWDLFLWLFRMALQFCFLLGACSEITSFSRRSLRGISNSESISAYSPVNLNTENPHQVVINNSLVSITLSRPEGYIIGISYGGIDNLLNTLIDVQYRGYMDVVWNQPGTPPQFQRIQGTKFSVITKDDDMVEISFFSEWTSSMEGSSVPMNIDQRYILRRGDSGFYSYAIFERSEGLPAVVVDQTRLVFRLREDMFNYMAISDTRQRIMPSLKDRNEGQHLAYPEAVLLTHSSIPQCRGEVDDKYQYSSENQDNNVQGWTTTDSAPTVGFWIITPSNEFRNGGPIKQDLTSHVGPTLLSMFTSTHYAGTDAVMAFKEGETFKKVFGPVFVYLNNASSNSKSLWSDAAKKLSNEVKSWPYDFPRSQDFFPSKQRGQVTGQLQVKDGGKTSVYPSNAYIGLAFPGEAGSWQTESKSYQFWTRTDENGNFKIENIVPGDYNLYAWIPGFIGDYKYNDIITIESGRSIELGTLVYRPPRNGYTLWEIGIPDRSAAEFFVPDPNPRLMNKLYKNDPHDKFRQYGLWERYTDLYPDHDLVYTVGVDNYKNHWFFSHVNRKIGKNTFQPTTWEIVFQLQNNTLKGKYTLQLALASASNAEVQVWFNGWNADYPYFTTGEIGNDSAIARHGIHGLHRLYSINVASDQLVTGKNTIYLRQSIATSPFQGVMYDYIRLESPPTPDT
ncbi:rhamnogalacturonate lyase B-like [Lotus japonicus]|uniref:rhamnogalacturonate lyase B-like n=1 Tax=Lotus japonicus TaxID=34305 RepID=UPI00259036FA|nr:rhamnogalacturonate lyase B-like [Lotus japonicus]